MKNKLYLDIVKGNEGYCLNLVDQSGTGERIIGVKPWGNPYNKPTYTFELDENKIREIINIFTECLNKYK